YLQVLTGKAKFGIFGDGKELAQVAMARSFKPGDFKAGYYRDQTFMMAAGVCTVQQFFAQLYAHPSIEAEPHSGGRQMNAHFATRFLDEEGKFKDLRESNNVAADASPTASQMGRSLGLALASKLYRESPELKEGTGFSTKGNEVAFVSIGDASTSEGLFWETVNAAGVMRVPLAIFVYDDGYGISVPIKYQTTKGSISEVLAGFQTNEEGEGLDIYTAKGWDYAGLCETIEKGISKVRETHIPAIFHIQEVTQPQGHSTSGSHERYKSAARLQWEKDADCLVKMQDWMFSAGLATEEEMDAILAEAKQEAKDGQKAATAAFKEDINAVQAEALQVLDGLVMESAKGEAVAAAKKGLQSTRDAGRREIYQAVRKALRITRGEQGQARKKLNNWINQQFEIAKDLFHSHLYSESELSALKVTEEPAIFNENSPVKNGFEVLNACFRENIKRDARIFAFGEDVGKIGDVNQGFAGLQDEFGEHRIFDTGIREATIMGQGLGMAMRGLRPIAEIQYLDYLIYGLQPLSDDLATLQYRTRGGQKAPLIVRTRGHRLEGIWHTGSPISMILGSLRGMYVLVPRNMTQAAGFYNTMLRSDDPALIIECLNGYRLKEKVPENIGTFTVSLGVPEVIKEGEDITVVTYGSCIRVVQEAIPALEEAGISIELVDVQTLLPFDIDHHILESVKKTNRVLFLDEDVPGGATAYMMQQVMAQGAFQYLDSAPEALSAAAHRGPYGSDGDYMSKPSADDIFETIYRIMQEAEPGYYPSLD
ncbi:MAG: 2-oxoisovalerate dehydrogenase E1 component, partial [Limisphaerales bacterium]